jgi:hypothetical protein
VIWVHLFIDKWYKDKYIRDMKNILQKYTAEIILLAPIIGYFAGAATYRLALEVWCIAYGLIY